MKALDLPCRLMFAYAWRGSERETKPETVCICDEWCVLVSKTDDEPALVLMDKLTPGWIIHNLRWHSDCIKPLDQALSEYDHVLYFREKWLNSWHSIGEFRGAMWHIQHAMRLEAEHNTKTLERLLCDETT